MKNLVNLFVICFLGQCSILQAQHIDLPENIQSPNAASLGKYGDTPVSYYTGTPAINIPIYTLNVKGIELSVNLSYNASGIRIDEHPGWVGQNWSLDAGGVITRTQRGQHFDEYTSVGTGLGIECDCGYMYQYGSLSEATVDTEDELKNLADSARWGYDYEPDIFTFNFMGKTGKFFLDNEGKWKVLSDENLSIIFENNLIVPLDNIYIPGSGNSYKYPKVIGGFKIKDENGTIYVFGYQPEAIEYSIDFFGQVWGFYLWKSNAWYLTKVIDKYGVEIYNFTYQRGDYIAQFYRTAGTTVSGYSGGTWIDSECYHYSSVLPNVVGGELISPVYLSSISTPFNGSTIAFERQVTTELKYDYHDLEYNVGLIISAYCPNGCGTINPFYYIGNPLSARDVVNSFRWYKLTGITAPQKYVKFVYNDNPDERLNLLQLDIYGEDHTPSDEKYSYQFHYNSYESLPGYLSRKIDHWGFYRGGTDYVIPQPQDWSTYYNQRLPNASYVTNGMLDQITTPVGGYTKFEYEPHTYNRIANAAGTGLVNETGIAGGVRIKKITNNDGTTDQVRNFKYVQNYVTNHNSTVSSGILSRKPKYHWPDWQVKSTSGGTLSQTIFSVNSIIPLSNAFGTHIGYSDVIEERNDGSYTLYKYSNYGVNGVYYDDPTLSTLNMNASPYDKISDLGMMRGKLLNLLFYDADNTLLKEKILTYRTDKNVLASNTQFYIIGCDAHYQNVCSGSGESAFHGSAYKLYFFDYDVIQEETKSYFGGNAVSEITTYEKSDVNLSNGNIRLQKSVTQSIPDGQLKTFFEYPTDRTYFDSYMGNLINDFRVGEIIQTRKLKNNDPVGATKMTYKMTNNLVVPGVLYTSHTNDIALQKETIYDKYDTQGNLLQYTPKDGVSTSTVWGYNNTLPVATITNANCQSNIENNSNTLAFYSPTGSSGGRLLDQNDVTNILAGSTATLSLISCFIPPNVTQPQSVTFYLVCNNTLYQKTLSASQSFTIPVTGSFSYLDIVKSDPNIIATGTFAYESRINPNQANEIYYQGFEEYPSAIFCNTSKTGEYIYFGSFSIPLSKIMPGNYKLSYWKSTDKTNWQYIEQSINISSGSTYYTIGESGLYLDEIRLCPSDAEITTYTYKPLTGMTSRSDPNGTTIYYEYDTFGRLKQGKNDDTHIMNRYNYHYKQ